MAKNNIIIFGDYTCPYCYIGQKTIEELQKYYDIELTHIPIQSDKDMPEFRISLQLYYKKKGIDIDLLYDDIEEKASKLNIILNRPTYKYNTNMTILLGEFARDNDLEYLYSSIIYNKYFEENENISSEEVLNDVFEQIELDYEEGFLRAYDGAYKARIKEYESLFDSYNLDSVPSFVINEEIVIPGLPKIESIEKHLYL